MSKETDKIRFCVTISQELTSGDYEAALEEFLEILHQMGANDDNINQLIAKSRTNWQEASDNLLTQVYVEVIKNNNDST